MPAGLMTWPLPTTHEPFGCGPVTEVGYGTAWAAAIAEKLSPAANRLASGLRRLLRDFFRELLLILRAIYRSPRYFFTPQDRPFCTEGEIRQSIIVADLNSGDVTPE